jgi:cation-transporting ATPase 13A3/4/5
MSLFRVLLASFFLWLPVFTQGHAIEREHRLKKFIAADAISLQANDESTQGGPDLDGATRAVKDVANRLPNSEIHVVNGDMVVVQTQRTWWMFFRDVEKEVMFAVHEWYVVAWCVAVATLLVLTCAFTIYSQTVTHKDESEICRPFEDVPTGESEHSTKHLVQKGFRTSMFGGAVFWLWVMLPLMGYLQMSLITMDHYLFALHAPDLTWSQWAQPFLLVFVLSHVTVFLQTQFLAKARVFFMLPTPLVEAASILLQDADSNTSDGALVEVETSEGDIRFFEYTCIRYVWSSANSCFLPVGTEAGLTGKEAATRLQQGGLTREEHHEREIVGPNIINVPVPGIFASLREEFLTPLYCFQFAVIWLYLFIDSWNISAVWFVWTLIAGISKSLFSVRTSRQQVADLARTETRATVMRQGSAEKWEEISSADVVPGDVIMVEEGVVCCDIVIVKGGAVVNESMLTGEPMPVQRFPIEHGESHAVSAKSHKKHLLFTGTIVMQSSGDASDAAGSSHCIGVALNTGPMTMKGSLIRTVLFPEPIIFKFTDQLPYVYLLMFLYVCCLFTLVQVKAQTGSWIFSIYIGFTILAQSLNPLLPVSITLGQTMGSGRLKEAEGIKCLSPQRLPIAGKVHVMVMDKTGTITKEGMEFRGAHIVKNDAFVEETQFVDEDGLLHAADLPEAVMWSLASCHTVTRLKDGTPVGNMVEVAMLDASGFQLSQDSKRVEKDETKIEIVKQLEFDQTRMTSGAVIQVGGKTVVLIKGSYERVRELTTSGVPKDFKQVTERFATEQYYVLGIGMKVIQGPVAETPRADLENGLSFLGLLLFRNEMKVDSPDAVLALQEGGVRAVICTGDNALTGAAIAQKCGLVQSGDQVILGDMEQGGTGGTPKEMLDWKILPENTSVTHADVMQKYPNAELVLTKPAFRKLLDSGELVGLLGRVRVYARMKPDDKVAVVNVHQEQGWVVGMVGDGGNDCGAMRAAHVGLALSEAEASIVAPFSSGADYGTGEKSLMAVPHLLRYGRATLQTNTGTFLFFVVYGLTLPSSKCVPLLMFNANMAEWDWLFIDIVLGVGFVMLMTSCWPSEKLAPIRPTGALLESRTLSSVFLHVAIFFLFYVSSLHLLWEQDFYVTYNTKELDIPAHEWPKKGDNFDCAVTFLVLATQLITAGYAGCLGAEHRQNILRNWKLTLAFVCFIGLMVILVIGGPSETHCIFRTNCDNYTSRKMYVPFVQEFSSGNVGGCFLGPQLQGWKEELGDRYRFPDEEKNKCFPADGFDPEEKLSVPSGALFGLGTSTCTGPHNCFGESFRITFAILLLVQCFSSILLHKLLLHWHPGHKKHFDKL